MTAVNDCDHGKLLYGRCPKCYAMIVNGLTADVYFQQLISDHRIVEEDPIQLLSSIALTTVNGDDVCWLISMLDHFDSRVRKAVLRALGDIGEEALESLPFVKKLLHDPDESVSTLAARAITLISNSAREG